MMDISHLLSYIEHLDDGIDDLEEVLQPLLSSSLTGTAGKLPLLDKAQLYVLVTYAIESLLFSYLRLNGINAKEHPVFLELTRVKQYFEKVKKAESAGEPITPATQLDKAAAGRFIKHALAGNDKHDQTIAKQLEERKLALQEKIASYKANKDRDRAPKEQIQKRELAATTKAQAMAQKRNLESGLENDPDGEMSSSSSDDSSSEDSAAVDDTRPPSNASQTSPTDKQAKIRKHLKASSKRKRLKT